MAFIQRGRRGTLGGLNEDGILEGTTCRPQFSVSTIMNDPILEENLSLRDVIQINKDAR